MFIPIRTDYRMSHTPWVNYALLAANIVIYILGYNGATEPGMLRIHPMTLHPEAPQLWQFFTSAFLHAGLLHLIGNMLFLWVFGNAINDRLGHLGYLAFYLSGGVVAGVGYVLLSPVAPVLGASGAISAVAGAYLVLLPRARVTVITWLFYVILPFEVSSLYFLLFQFLWNLLLLWEELGGASAGVAYWAHISGYVFGIALAAMLLAIHVLPRDAFDLPNLLRAWQRRHRFRRMVASGYDPFYGSVKPPIPPVDSEGQWTPTRTVAAEPSRTTSAMEIQLRREITESVNLHDLAAAADKYLQLVQVADDAVLPRQQQLDVANQLMSSDRHPQAADAYERFLKHYSSYEHTPDIQLMLGILYSRYLHQYDRAQGYLQHAVEALRDPRKVNLAQTELEAIRRRR